jgi:two-component system sensor histidine kinase YesM
MLFVLIPIYSAMFVFYDVYRDSLEEKAQDYTIKSFEQVYNVVGNRLLDMIKVSNFIVFNPQAKQISERTDVKLDWQYNNDITTMDLLFLEAQNISGIANVDFTLLLADGRVFGNWMSLPGAEELSSSWYRQGIQNSPFPVWLIPKENEDPNKSKGAQMISIVQSMRNEKGVIRTSIASSSVTGWLRATKNTWDTIVYNENGERVYGTVGKAYESILEANKSKFAQWDTSTSEQFNQDGYRMIYRSLPIRGWTVVQVIDEVHLYKDIKSLTRGFVFISFVFFLVFIGITAIVTNRIVRPLKQLKKAMNQVGHGNWDVKIEQETHDELGQMTFHFNRMVKQIQQLVERLQIEERNKSKLYYESLLAQINPHFLFNTLNSIKWVASLSKAKHVAELITSLGTILEMTTSRVQDSIRLEQELDLIRHYMKLQYARFGERVELVMDVPQDLLTLQVPKFILQPLVENAIIHGFEQHDLRGEIRIEARRHREDILLFVKDNGRGIQPDQFMTLFENNRKGHQSMHGIGVRNVQERVRMMYGSQYGIMFSSEEGILTTVRISLPAIESTEGYGHV